MFSIKNFFNFSSRYDYENCDSDKSNKMMDNLEELITKPGFIATKLTELNKTYVVKEASNYSYKDPIDGSVASKQVR